MTTDRTALEAARDALPPLPASHYVPDTDPAFTAQQMRDYAAQAVTAALSSPPVLPAEPVGEVECCDSFRKRSKHYASGTHGAAL
jgi:hypothetical protein